VKKHIGRFAAKDVTRKSYREVSPLASLLLKWPLHFAALPKFVHNPRSTSEICTAFHVTKLFSLYVPCSHLQDKRGAAHPKGLQFLLEIQPALFLLNDEMPFNFEVFVITCRSGGGKLARKGFKLSLNFEISAI
jgi:hypothetical protein